ncbi:hypothetical protein L0Y46_01025 [bacterium]|nr:hypothetical protein [bacterium]
MNPKIFLKIIFAISVIGVLFSGSLLYQEFFGEGTIACPSFGYPTCLYGFAMYIALVIVSLAGLFRMRKF